MWQREMSTLGIPKVAQSGTTAPAYTVQFGPYLQAIPIIEE
jgi:hypothetical protein